LAKLAKKSYKQIRIAEKLKCLMSVDAKITEKYLK
jgi:hypothetical protein